MFRGAFPRRRLAVTLTVGVSVLAAAASLTAQTQTAAGLFGRAQTQEQGLGEASTIDAIRQAARAYENVVRRFPNSSYCDNALWQASLMFERAWTRSSVGRDKDDAVRVLSWLVREYPSSSLVPQARSRASALQAAQLQDPGDDQDRSPPADAPLPPPSLPQTQTPAPAVVIRNIAHAPLPRGDRITIELSGEVTFSGDRVGNPDRVFFDFPSSTAAPAVGGQLKSVQSPLIKAVRVGSPTRGVTRVVLELAGSPRYSAYPLYSPFRLVIDVEGPAASSAAPAAPGSTPTPAPTPATPPVTPPAAKPTPTATPAPPPVAPANGPPPPTPVPPSITGRGDYSLSRQLGLRIAKIVIDPGHGGHDPGAMANGVTESELVLDVALRLEKLLQQSPGVEVVLTRRTNEFVPLEERTAIANRERADLFLSIHANSHRHSSVRGIETYFLNFANSPDAEAVAARENAASVQTMGTLPAIVKAIYLNDKLDESREFATVLQTSLTRRMRQQYSATKDLGVKQAPFVVLIGATMPSVLTEIAFITNKPEAALLKQSSHRQLIAQALRDAVTKYQDSLKRVATSPSATGAPKVR